MGRKKKYTYSETQNGEEIMTEVETDEDTVEPSAVEPVPVVEPVVEPVTVVEPVVETVPVVEPVVEPKVEPTPVPSKPVRYRYGQVFEHPTYGRVQVVSVPKQGKFSIRILKNRRVVPFTGI